MVTVGDMNHLGRVDDDTVVGPTDHLVSPGLFLFLEKEVTGCCPPLTK